jgi:DNA polymerase I-like protein with 3'-5' exonuclease and polymerase domains
MVTRVDEQLNTKGNDDLLDFEELFSAMPTLKATGKTEFQPDEYYVRAYQSYLSEKEQEQAHLQKAKAQPVTPKPTTNGHASEPVNHPNASKPAKNGTKPAKFVIAPSFPGPNLPSIEISAMPPVHYEVIKSSEQLEEVAKRLANEPLLSVDTETNGLDPYTSKLMLVQVASPEKTYVIDAQKVPLAPLKPLLENEKSLKLFQNGKFDYKFLKVHAGIEVNNIFDTYLSERLITAGLGKEANLAAIVERYLKIKLDKSVRKTFYGSAGLNLTAEQLAYAARDVLALFPIYYQQKELLKKEKLLQSADVEFRCLLAVGDLELNGCLLDVEKWRGILREVEQKRDAVRAELMDMLPGGGAKQASMFGGDEYLINLNSAAQIMAEFKKIGIELEGTSEAELNKHNRLEVKKLLEYRGHEKTLGSFGEGLLALINPKTGRIHPDFQQYGADTGRFSCSNPNVQQIPANSDFRSCFIAPPGYKLITSDYSQAELRILAELSGDPAFLGAFESGGDLHKLAASQMFGVKIEEVSKEQRSAAKAINFGLAYGMGAQGLAVRIDKTVDEARELIAAYFKAFNGVQKWLEKAGRDSVSKGFAPTPLGRKRYFDQPNRDDFDYRRKMSEIERQGKNAPIQGANADMTKIALVFLREKLRSYDARLVNTVHDEIVVEVREDQAEEVCLLVEHEMVAAGKEILRSVPILAEAKIGDYWSK